MDISSKILMEKPWKKLLSFLVPHYADYTFMYELATYGVVAPTPGRNLIRGHVRNVREHPSVYPTCGPGVPSSVLL
jgi:hypothetical protein